MSEDHNTTDIRMHIEIAELRGWTGFGDGPWDQGKPPPNGCEQLYQHPPNYTECLNACHEFEVAMRDNSDANYNWFLYMNELKYIESRDGVAETLCSGIAATARQKCEAFLRVMR